MVKHQGAVIVFKQGVTHAQALEALAKIASRLERMPVPEEFDDEYGGPVFYIP